MKRRWNSIGPLGLTAWGIYALERFIGGRALQDETWTLLFQMLWSFDRIGHISYRELLLSLTPEAVLSEPYTAEHWVCPPSGFCWSKAELERYQMPEWSRSNWAEWIARLPQNEFGYLHPEPGNPSFLGISQNTYNRLYTLYHRCPDSILRPLAQVLEALTGYLLEVQDGAVCGGDLALERAVLDLGLEAPPTEPFRIYKRGMFQDLGHREAQMFFLGRPRPRSELSLPPIFIETGSGYPEH